MFEFDIIQSGLIIAALFVVGEIISRKLKAIIPAVLVSGIIFMALLWSGIVPVDMVERSKLGVLMPVGMMFIILSMGSNTSLKEMAANWRVVLLAAVSYIFELCMILLVVSFIFDWNMAVSAFPGSSAATLIVQERARALGYNDCVILSVLLLFLNGMVACPIVGVLIKKEAKRIIANGIPELADNRLGASPVKETKKSGGSSYVSFFKFYLGAWICQRLSLIIGISPYVLCLVLGVVFSEIGFFRRDELKRTESNGFLFFILMAMILNSFGASSPEMLLQVLLPIVVVLCTAVLSLSLSSLVLGKFLGFSPWMSVALGFNIMVGFPVNLMLAQDMINFLIDDEQERSYLMEQIGNRMVLAGFTSTTFLSNTLGPIVATLLR
ncbi:MAG: hypothetical protein IIX72_01775 [Oscillospiraceae bacterium]|nr:hypothetical protein [Oscillospiraceae bacterium]